MDITVTKEVNEQGYVTISVNGELLICDGDWLPSSRSNITKLLTEAVDESKYGIFMTNTINGPISLRYGTYTKLFEKLWEYNDENLSAREIADKIKLICTPIIAWVKECKGKASKETAITSLSELSDEQKLLLLFRISDEAKDNSDYDVSNACFAIMDSYRDWDGMKCIYESARSYSTRNDDATYYDLMVFERQDKRACIPVPLIRRDIAIIMASQAILIDKLDHKRACNAFNAAIRERHIKELTSVFDCRLIDDYLRSVLENPPIYLFDNSTF